MTFISDGTRTWDPERNFELNRTRRDSEFSDFELIGPHGTALFLGEYKFQRKKSSNESKNVNDDIVMVWKIIIQKILPGFDLESTKNIINQSLESFEYFHGIDRIKGNKVGGIICNFEGKYA